MSEKPALDPQPAVEKTYQDQDQAHSSTLTSDPPKKKPRARLWKLLCYIGANAQLISLHKFALTHAQEAHRARWAELTAWISPWVRLFFVRTIHLLLITSIHSSDIPSVSCRVMNPRQHG
jgi:hypothetical protein